MVQAFDRIVPEQQATRQEETSLSTGQRPVPVPALPPPRYRTREDIFQDDQHLIQLGREWQNPLFIASPVPGEVHPTIAARPISQVVHWPDSEAATEELENCYTASPAPYYVPGMFSPGPTRKSPSKSSKGSPVYHDIQFSPTPKEHPC